jgi:hypothetical protein
MLPIALCLFALAAGDAPAITVTSSARSTGATASGVDAGFDQALDLRDSDGGAAGEWVSDLDADLHDGGGAPVARGRSYQESQIEASSLYFTLDVSAATSGLHQESEAGGSGAFQAVFEAGRLLRYAVRAHADLSSGPSAGASLVRLEGAAGAVFELAPEPGGAQDLLTSGWLVAGSYALVGRADAVASGTPGAPKAQSGNAECDLALYAAGDFDLDGDVDLLDRGAYLVAYGAGERAADLDGDGRLALADLAAFARAWRASR